MKIRRVNPMLRSLLLGVGVYGIVGLVIVLVVTDDKWWNLLGFIIGVLMSVFVVIHMSMSIDVAVHQDEDGALKYTKIMYIVRIILVAGVIVSMIIWKYANPVATLFGLFSLKFSAYSKLITIKFKSKGR